MTIYIKEVISGTYSKGDISDDNEDNGDQWDRWFLIRWMRNSLFLSFLLYSSSFNCNRPINVSLSINTLWPLQLIIQNVILLITLTPIINWIREGQLILLEQLRKWNSVNNHRFVIDINYWLSLNPHLSNWIHFVRNYPRATTTNLWENQFVHIHNWIILSFHLTST